MEKNSKVDLFINKKSEYKKQLHTLREICLSKGLAETLKWGAPTYTIDGKNVLGLGAFKSYYGLWFFNGVFMKDPFNKLINAQESKTKALRQMRFEKDEDPDVNLIQKYIEEAIRVHHTGQTIKPEKISSPPDLTLEFREFITNDLELKSAFRKLSPSIQKEYINYISEAKQAATKQRRWQKIKPLILKGKGLNDQYKK